MAVIRGEQGAVQFNQAGGVNAIIVGTRSWTLSVTKETLDTSAHPSSANTADQGFRTFVGSLVSGSGTVELVYDPDAAAQPTFIEDIVTLADPGDATFELFTTGLISGSDSLSFKGIITSMDIASTVGELVIITCNFITNGAITSNLQ